MSQGGFGQSTCVGIGGDPINGTNMVDALALFQKDRKTNRIVLVGEIGGTAEEEAAEFIKKTVTKPVVAYVADEPRHPENGWVMRARLSKREGGPRNQRSARSTKRVSRSHSTPGMSRSCSLPHDAGIFDQRLLAKEEPNRFLRHRTR